MAEVLDDYDGLKRQKIENADTVPISVDQYCVDALPDTSANAFNSPVKLGKSMHEMKWNNMFALLLEYSELENRGGNCRLPMNLVVFSPLNDSSGRAHEKVNLGLWLGTQRQHHRKGLLRSDREAKLQALVDAGRLDWGDIKLTKDDERWESMFGNLLDYCKVHGNCNILERQSVTLCDGTTVKLGRWLDGQRQTYRAGKMRDDRMQKLQALVNNGTLKWTTAGEDDRKWDYCFNAFSAYCYEYNKNNLSTNNNAYNPLGNGNDVPTAAEESGKVDGDVGANKIVMMSQCQRALLEDGSVFRLGQWVAHQQQKKKEGKIRLDRQARLQELVDRGVFKWHDNQTVRGKDERWQCCYDALLLYGEKHGGNCNVPRSFDTTFEVAGDAADGAEGQDGGTTLTIKLGMWLHSQKDSYKRGKLSGHRLEKMQDLIFQGKLTWDSLKRRGKRRIEDAPPASPAQEDRSHFNGEQPLPTQNYHLEQQQQQQQHQLLLQEQQQQELQRQMQQEMLMINAASSSAIGSHYGHIMSSASMNENMNHPPMNQQPFLDDMPPYHLLLEHQKLLQSEQLDRAHPIYYPIQTAADSDPEQPTYMHQTLLNYQHQHSVRGDCTRPSDYRPPDYGPIAGNYYQQEPLQEQQQHHMQQEHNQQQFQQEHHMQEQLQQQQLQNEQEQHIQSRQLHARRQSIDHNQEGNLNPLSFNEGDMI